VSLDDVAVRVVDKEGKSVGPGETGEIVISNLNNRATVLLNYKLGDMVTVSSSPCSCGRTLPMIQRIEGRSDDLVVLPDGRVVHSLVVLQGLRTVPGIIQLQLVQEEPQRFSLRAVCSGQIEWHQASRDLDAVLRRLFGEEIALHLERVEAIAPESGGKVRAVISRCLPARS
jgi:phenylacetate-CoA ligase